MGSDPAGTYSEFDIRYSIFEKTKILFLLRGEKTMKIGFFQFEPKFGKIKENVEYAADKLSSADADLIVLPELFNTGYLFLSKDELKNLAEPVPNGYTSKALINLAKKKKMYLVAGLAELSKDKVYNSAVLIGPEGFITCYRKAHLFYEETLYFTKGDTPFEVFDAGFAKIGIMICFDWYFPEVSRILALKGAQILCQPANLVLSNCPRAMIIRSLENKVFSITANRIGKETRDGKSLSYIGKSQIVSPLGKILLHSDGKNEKLGIVEIDPKTADNKKVLKYNDLLLDRRVDLYGDLLS